MLQHSKKTSGQKAPTDINALADEYLRLSFNGMRDKDKSFSEGIPMANTILNTDFDYSVGLMNITPQGISRVLLNLYNNALYVVNEKKVKGIGYQPTVSESTRKTENSVTICVSDNDNGIPQNILDKIFQPFFTTNPTGQGTGLGLSLSLSYDIVKTHGE
jgi:two-component system NtrC family sensor kinase